MRRDTASSLVLLSFFVGYGVSATQIHIPHFLANEAFGARTMPYGLAAIGIALASVQLILSLAKTADATPASAPLRNLDWRRVGLLAVLMVAYGLTIKPAGFVISTALFLVAGFWALGERRWGILLLASLPLTIGFWAIMTQLLGIYLEPGRITAWLGI